MIKQILNFFQNSLRKALHDELIIEISLLKENLLRKLTLSELFQKDSEYFLNTKKEFEERSKKMNESLQRGKDLMEQLEKQTNTAEYIDKMIETFSSLEDSQSQQKKIDNIEQKVDDAKKTKNALLSKKGEKIINFQKLLNAMDTLKKK